MSDFDSIGAIALTGGAAALVATLVPAAFAKTWARLGAGALLAIWFGAVVAGGAVLIFSPSVGLGTPGLGGAVLVPVIGVVALATFIPRLRHAFDAIPLTTLIVVNSIRLLGVFFLLLYAAGRLPAPFALSAGWGDIIVGATAPFVAWLAARQAVGWRVAVWLWNGLGILDLFAAVGLGAVTAAGSPVRLIVATPDTGLMTALPWIVIPAFVVPLLLLTHVAVLARLLRSGSGSTSRALAGWATRLAD